MADKKYLRGSAKQVSFNNGGSIINLSFNIKELIDLAGGGDWINITVADRRQEDKYGNTHYCYLNEWKPEKGKQVGGKGPSGNGDSADDGILPF